MSNYFTSSIKHYGTDDFIPLLRPEDIQRSAKERIFREMVRGKIDYPEFGKHYLDSKFLANLIVACENELTNNDVIAQSLILFDTVNPGHIEIIHNRTKFCYLVEIYRYLLDRLKTLEVTGNVGVLTDIQFRLNSVKQYI